MRRHSIFRLYLALLGLVVAAPALHAVAAAAFLVGTMIVLVLMAMRSSRLLRAFLILVLLRGALVFAGAIATAVAARAIPAVEQAIRARAPDPDGEGSVRMATPRSAGTPTRHNQQNARRSWTSMTWALLLPMPRLVRPRCRRLRRRAANGRLRAARSSCDGDGGRTRRLLRESRATNGLAVNAVETPDVRRSRPLLERRDDSAHRLKDHARAFHFEPDPETRNAPTASRWPSAAAPANVSLSSCRNSRSSPASRAGGSRDPIAEVRRPSRVQPARDPPRHMATRSRNRGRIDRAADGGRRHASRPPKCPPRCGSCPMARSRPLASI